MMVRLNFAGRDDAAGAAETAERTEKRTAMVEDFIVYVCVCACVCWW